MELIAKLWKNFKVQPEIWFFYGFLLTFALTIRKVLWFFPLRGEFNEYSGAYLYLSDIFLVLTLVAWIITILYNKIGTLSILKNVPPQKQENCSTPVEMFHVEHSTGQAWNNFLLRGGRGIMIYIMLPLALVIWSFISLIWAENKIVAIFKSVKMLEFYLLYIFVLIRFFCWNVPSQQECSTWNILRDKRGTILKKVFGLIMFIGLFQAIIGIGQFILQHSIGLFWLKESLISPDIAGVAKVIFSREAFVRAYGLFPHPNILGGFLLFSFLVSLLYYRMFHARLDSQSLVDARRVEQLIKVSLGIQLLAMILTFSKSAITGLFLGLSYYVYKNVPPQKECSTPEAKELFHVEQFFAPGQAWNNLWDKSKTLRNFLKSRRRLLITSGLIFIIAVSILKPDWNSLFIKSLNQRSVYVNVSPARLAILSIAGGRGTMEDAKTLIFGIGNSQFVISMENLSAIKENWMLQPVHNVFLLVWSELGLVGFLILVLFIGFILKGMFHIKRNIPRPPRIDKQSLRVEEGGTILCDERGTSSELAKTFGAIFIGLLFIMFFDHYLWDIQQGSFLLWMTLGFLVGSIKTVDYLTI